MPSASCLRVLALAATLSGPLLGCSAMDKPAWLAQKQANDAEDNFYAEVEYGDPVRIYVIGKSATLTAFQQMHEMAYSQTFVGEGPGGKTVVVEAEAKEMGLQARLRRTFAAKHGITLGK